MAKLIAQYFLNDRLTLEEIEWQVEQIAKAGYDAIYPHARQGLLTPYMSEAWWQAMVKILEGCRRYGMEFWLWDEDYFPSGLAGGRVVWDEPGFIARELTFQIVDAQGQGPFEVDFSPGMLLEAFAIEKTADGKFAEPIKITNFCGTRRQSWTKREVLHGAYSPQVAPLGHPHWRSGMVDNRFALTWQPEQAGAYLIVGVLVTNNQGVHPDILRQEVVKKFINLSHEEYYKRFGDEFGKIIKGAFTDEPSPGGALYPWTAKFSEEFYRDHGYDLLAYLPHLVLDLDARSAAVRHHYRLTQHRLQCQNYVQQISAWCSEHGMEMAGHLTRTEWLSLVSAWWPNELRCYKQMDIPCTDPLGASCGWKDAASYHSGIKVASSAAHLFKRAQAGSDALAVVGDEASLRDLKYLLDYQMVLGINHFGLHGLSYSLDGPRKDEVPPSIFYQHSEWKQMPVLLDYLKKTCEELTGGTHVCQIAILYPSTSLVCQVKPQAHWPYLEDEALIHDVVESLLSKQKDFDFIDEVTLQENVTDKGELTTPEKYRYLILPYLRFIDQRTANALLKFAAAGGKIIVIGRKPLAITQDLKEPVVTWTHEKIKFYETIDDSFWEELPGLEVKGEGKEDIFVLERQKEDGRRIFVFNRREEEFRGEILGQTIEIPPRGSILLKSTTNHEELICLPEVPRETERELVADLSTGWNVQFEPNQVPLNFWHVVAADESFQNPFSAPAFDLMQREIDPAGENDQRIHYHCRFMFSGKVGDAKLVIEDSAILGDWKLFVNEIPIENWERQRVFDCANKVADISYAIKGGSTPTLNSITIETSGPGRGLKEVLYLCGAFTCEYRYSHPSFPFLKGSNSIVLNNLLPWATIGYPTFSGSAVYQREFELTESQELWLDLGRVDDIACVKIDGELRDTLPWPPYICSLGKLTPKKHLLSVEISNAPANRTRGARLSAGLLGPVKLLKTK